MSGINDPGSSIENIAYAERKELNQDAKKRIAAEVVKHIPERTSIFVNIGTTTEAVAQALMRHSELRVVTNNLNVATTMSANPGFEVIVAGGIVRTRDRGIVGEATIDLIRQFRLDFAIIGISGIDETGALLDFDYREVRVSQAIMEQARHTLLVADHSKFGRNATVRVGHLSEIEALFTDKEPRSPWSEVLSRSSTKVYVAGASD